MISCKPGPEWLRWLPDNTAMMTVTSGRFTIYPLDGAKPYVLNGSWSGAGHPSIQPGDGRYLATDVFQYKAGRALLRLCDLKTGRCEDVLEAEYRDFSNQSGTHLHPAWSPDGKSLLINSAHTGAAQMYRVDVSIY